MKRFIKPTVSILLIVLFLQCLCGCFDRRELDTIGIVMGTAIDKAEQNEGFEVTIQLANPTKGGSDKGSKTKKDGSGGESSEYINISETGRSINYIIREIQNKMSRMIYVAHSQNIVIGEELAKEDVKDCLDFYARAPEARMTQFLFVAEGKASDIYDVPAEFESMPSTMLTKMLKDQRLTSQAPVVTEFEFMCCMIRKTKSPVMPIVRIIEDEDKKRLEVDGCAVFKENRMVGTFDETETRGMLFIENKVKSGAITVELEDAVLTVEISKAQGSVNAHLYEDGSIRYDVRVNVTAGLGDQTGTFNAADPDNAPQFLHAVEDAVKNEIQSAVDKSKELDADVFGFGESLKRKYPDQWDALADKWDELYPEAAVDISVEARADGSGRISMPLVPETI